MSLVIVYVIVQMVSEGPLNEVTTKHCRMKSSMMNSKLFVGKRPCCLDWVSKKKAQSLPRLVNDFETMLSIVGSSCQRSSCSLWSLVVGTQQPGRWQLAQGGCTIYNSPLNPWLLLLSTTGRVGRRRWSPTPCQGCVTCPNSAQLDNPHAAHGAPRCSAAV